MKTLVDRVLHPSLAVVFAVDGDAQEGMRERLKAESMHLHRQERDEEAVAIGQHALAVAEISFSPLNPKLATTQTNLAEICRASGPIPQPERLYRDAVGIFGRTLRPEHALASDCILETFQRRHILDEAAIL